MAEGLLRNLGDGEFEVFSAGTEVTRVHPVAIAAMRELGIDISHQRSKHLDEYRGQKFDYVITVCDRANEQCPIFPDDPVRIHWSFTDPSSANGDTEAQLRVFRRVRDDIQGRIRTLITLARRDRAATTGRSS
jgi:arsenate reductase